MTYGKSACTIGLVMSTPEFEVPQMPQSVDALFSRSQAYGYGENYGWENFCDRFNKKGYTCLYITDICGTVFADFFMYYDMEKVMFANLLGVSSRTIHNWAHPDTKSIPLRWHDKLERAIATVHRFRHANGWDAPITAQALNAAKASNSGDAALNNALNVMVLSELHENCREELNQLAEFYDMTTEKLVYQALQEWAFTRMHEIYRSVYELEMEDEALIAGPFGALDANMRAYQAAMSEMRLNQLSLNECSYADEERIRTLKEQRVASAFAKQMELQAERQRKHAEAALERSKVRVDEAKKGVEKALRLMPGDGTFNTYEAHRAHNASIQQQAMENAPEEEPAPAPALEEDCPF